MLNVCLIEYYMFVWLNVKCAVWWNVHCFVHEMLNAFVVQLYFSE